MGSISDMESYDFKKPNDVEVSNRFATFEN
jgi:hypothetical protein